MEHISKDTIKCNIQFNQVKKKVAPAASINETAEDLSVLLEDMNFVQHFDEFNFKTVETVVSDKSLINFVNVTLKDGRNKLIRKSSILWMLTNKETPLSNDRLLKYKSKINIDANIDKNCKDFVFVGDLVAFLEPNGQFSLGQIINFKYLSGSNTNFTQNFCPINAPKNVSGKGILCFCVYFNIFENGELKEYVDNSCRNLDTYFCHATVTRLGKNYKLSESSFEKLRAFL